MVCIVLLLGSDASVVVDSDVDDDSLVHIHNRGSVKTFEVDKVFGPNSTQQEVPTILLFSSGMCEITHNSL